MNLQNKNQKICITRRHGNPRRNFDLNKSDLFTTRLPSIRSPASNKKGCCSLCCSLEPVETVRPDDTWNGRFAGSWVLKMLRRLSSGFSTSVCRSKTIFKVHSSQYRNWECHQYFFFFSPSLFPSLSLLLVRFSGFWDPEKQHLSVKWWQFLVVTLSHLANPVRS